MSGTKTESIKITGPNAVEEMKRRVMEEHDAWHTEHVRTVLMKDYQERTERPKQSPK